jgi:hypothetical protein
MRLGFWIEIGKMWKGLLDTEIYRLQTMVCEETEHCHRLTAVDGVVDKVTLVFAVSPLSIRTVSLPHAQPMAPHRTPNRSLPMYRYATLTRVIVALLAMTAHCSC